MGDYGENVRIPVVICGMQEIKVWMQEMEWGFSQSG